MTRFPVVSVVIPAYNAEATLAGTVESVLAQTLEDIEVLIVDDGSSDFTRGLAEAYAARDARVRVLGQINAGVAEARNTGLHNARAEFVAPIDADDLWHPTKLEKEVAALRAAGPGTLFAYSWSRVIDSDDWVLDNGVAHHICGRVFHRHLVLNIVNNGSGMTMRREAALAAGGYEPNLRAQGVEGAEDLLLQLRLASRGRVALTPEYLVGYRFAPGTMSRNIPRARRARQRVVETMREICTDADPRPFDWAIARAEAERAYHEAMLGRLFTALRVASRSALRDPRGFVQAAGEVTVKRGRDLTHSRLGQAVFGAPDPENWPPRRFFDYDPKEGERPPTGGLWARRLVWLARLDEDQARRLDAPVPDAPRPAAAGE